MMHPRRSAAVFALVFLRALASQCMASVPSVTIPYVAKGPVLRGDLRDRLWAQGALLTGFVGISENSVITQATEARVLYDSHYVYLGIRCAESNPDGMVKSIKDHDGPAWQDDCIELLFDTANGHHTVYHIIVNSIGTVSDEKCMDVDRSVAGWNSHCRVKAGKSSGAWILEIAVPFRDFGITPCVGLDWGLNVCRARYAGAKEYSSWSPTPGGFVQPRNLGAIVFGDKVSRCEGIELVSWGNLDSDLSYGGRNVVECLIPTTDHTPEIHDVMLRGYVNGKPTITVRRKVYLTTGGRATIELPYKMSGSANETFLLTVSRDGRTEFKASHPSMAIPQSPRVWQLRDPLFEELLSNTPPAEQKNGAIYWFHSGIDSQLNPFAKEYGLNFSLDGAYKELVDARFMPIMQTVPLKSELFARMEAQHPYKVLFQPDYRGSRDKGVPQTGGLPYVLDPRSKDAYFSDLRQGIALARKHIWAIYTQDEITEKAIKEGVEFFSKMKDSYPYIREVDEQVRNEFGYGKYGIPLSPADENPFRWIAYHKWVNKQLLDWQKETYEVTKQLAPEMKVVSIDPVAGHNPFELDKWTPYIDIATHQLYPSSNPNRQEFGFVTKWVADLTGKPVWPCTHVENYAYSTTAEETRELMSEVMRSGGTGFHLYIPDVRGGGANSGDTFLTKYGSPERYRAIREILSTTCSMNEVAVPTDPDCAIFYSEDHFQSFPAPDLTYPNQPEYAYTFLGPVARTWFKFVNDNMVLDGKADLTKYKALFVPAATYERPEVIDRLRAYVDGGGTLVCGDPEAFNWSPAGDSLVPVRQSLLGAVAEGESKHTLAVFTKNCSLPHLRGLKLPVIGKAFDLRLCGSSEVLAKFENGKPAVIRYRIGKGSVIYFAFSPFTEKVIADQGWKSAFKGMASDLGLKTGRDIWRFKFPAYKSVDQPDPTGVCLTGNFVKWHQERPLDICNVATDGKYSYSSAPDGIADRDDLTFGAGKLTDRKRAPSVPKSKLKPEDFIVTWKSGTPVAVTFDFGIAYPANKLHLYYSDQLPALTVEGSNDEKQWTPLSNSPKQPATKDVLDLLLTWDGGQPYRFVRLSLGERDPGQAMTLVECEVWAESPK